MDLCCFKRFRPEINRPPAIESLRQEVSEFFLWICWEYDKYRKNTKLSKEKKRHLHVSLPGTGRHIWAELRRLCRRLRIDRWSRHKPSGRSSSLTDLQRRDKQRRRVKQRDGRINKVSQQTKTSTSSGGKLWLLLPLHRERNPDSFMSLWAMKQTESRAAGKTHTRFTAQHNTGDECLSGAAMCHKSRQQVPELQVSQSQSRNTDVWCDETLQSEEKSAGF